MPALENAALSRRAPDLGTRQRHARICTRERLYLTPDCAGARSIRGSERAGRRQPVEHHRERLVEGAVQSCEQAARRVSWEGVKAARWRHAVMWQSGRRGLQVKGAQLVHREANTSHSELIARRTIT